MVGRAFAEGRNQRAGGDIGFYGLSAESIEDAFAKCASWRRAAAVNNFFSQYNINPRADEHLTEAQWEEAHALHRKNHGLDHLPYFRVRHIKNGRVHEHGIALRVDPETGKAISDSLTAPVNERTARSLKSNSTSRAAKAFSPPTAMSGPERRPNIGKHFAARKAGLTRKPLAGNSARSKSAATTGRVSARHSRRLALHAHAGRPGLSGG